MARWTPGDTINEHGVNVDRIKVGSIVRGLQSGDPMKGGGRVRTVQVDKLHGGRMTVHSVDDLQPQGSTDLAHVADVTSIVCE